MIIPFYSLSTAKKLERWQRAITRMRRLTPHQRQHHFNMSTWGKQTACGTVACAAGFCGMTPWFRRRGLQLNLGPGFSSLDYSLGVRDFFGDGASIFFDQTIRPVERVIEQMVRHRDQLKEELKNVHKS